MSADPTPIAVDEHAWIGPWRDEHALELFELVMANRERLSEFLPWARGYRSLDQAREFIEQARSGYRSGSSRETGLFVDGGIVGAIGFPRIDAARGEAEIGYWLARSHAGRGLMTAACRALVDFAFATLRLDRVHIAARLDNLRSRAVAERLGLRMIGEEARVPRGQSEPERMAIYEMRRTQWSRLGPAGRVGGRRRRDG